MAFMAQGLGYRLIARDLGFGDNSVMAIGQRRRIADVPPLFA